MELKNKYLKRKKGVRDLEIVILGERYFINPQMLPFIAARVYSEDNQIYAFIVVNKRGRVQFLRPSDTLAVLSICTFRNASSKEELIKNADIPSCMIDSNNRFYPMKKIKEVYGNVSTAEVVKSDGKKSDVTVTSDIQQAGVRNERSFSYSGNKDTGYNLGYKDGFSMTASVPEELYPIIESKYIELKKKYANKFNVRLTFLSRAVDKEKGTATVTFRIEGVIKSPEWIVLGIIFHNDDRTVVEPMVKVSDETLDMMYKLPCKCDICGENRKRVKTYYLQNLQDRTKFVQAATHCMDKTIGVNELAAAVGFEELLKLARTEEIEKYREEGRNYFNSLDIFATTYLNLAYGSEAIIGAYRVGCYDDLSGEDKALVDSAIQWINSLDTNYELFRNVQTLLKCNNTHKRFIPKYRKIWSIYLNYRRYKEEEYKDRVEDFEKLKSDLKSRLDKYGQTRADYIAYNERLKVEIDEELRRVNEEIRRSNEEKREGFRQGRSGGIAEAKKRYEQELDRYNQCMRLKDTMLPAELIKYENSLADKYNIERKLSMRTFKPDVDWVTVRVRSVALKAILKNHYGDGKVGPYVFITDEGFKISWFIKLDKAKELGLPQEAGVQVEINKILNCKVKQYISRYDELQVTYCRFVEETDFKPTSLVVGLKDLEKVPVEPQYDKIVVKDTNTYAREKTKEDIIRDRGYSYKDIEGLDLGHEVDLKVKDTILAINPETFYDISYLLLSEEYGSLLRKFWRSDNKSGAWSDEVQGIKSFDVLSITFLDIKEYSKQYVILYETDKGYVMGTLDKDRDYSVRYNLLTSMAKKALGVKIKLSGVTLKNYYIYRVSSIRTDKNKDERLYYINKGDLYIGDKELKRGD